MINIKMWFLIIVLNLSGVIGQSNLEERPIVAVNGVQLTTDASKSGDSFNSSANYEFYDDELVTITCSRKKDPLGILKLSSHVHGCVINTIPKMISEDVFYLKLREENNGSFIDCRATSYSNKYPFVIRINLTLIDIESESQNIGNGLIQPPERCKIGEKQSKTDDLFPCTNGTVIGGLLKDNIIGMYNSLHINVSILYEYFDGDVLNLTCDAVNNDTVKWIYSDKIENNNTNNGFSVAPIAGSFKINSNLTRCAAITCEAKDKYYEIILKRYQETTSSSLLTTNTNSKGSPEKDITRNKGDTFKPSSLMIISFIVSALVFIAVMICIIIRICKTKPEPVSTDSNINYLNLPEQYQEAQYSTPKDILGNNDYAVPFKPTVDELYALPIPKNQRPVNGASASVSKDDLNANYAADVPKNSRKGVQVLPVKPAIAKKPDMKRAADNEDPYAEVTPSESSYADSASPYAEIHIIEKSYPESDNSYAEPNDLQTKKYVNIFKDSRYVNARAKEDYAEPAYCEVNKPRI